MSAGPTRGGDVATVLAAAEGRLAAAGVASPAADARLLLAHALEVSPAEVGRLRALRRELPTDGAAALARLVDARCVRVPLQHLTGRCAFRRLELRVGPGVFVPRPETEVVAGVVIDDLVARALDPGGAWPEHREPVVVDLCTGSGAIALAVKDEVPCAIVHAVEADAEAFAWARSNVEATGLEVELHHGDAGDALPQLDGLVDVVVSNPPYIPTEMVPVDPEVAEHDPEIALYGGSADGLAIPLAVARTAARLLRPGGLLVMEHADSQGESLPTSLRATGEWTEVRDETDLAGRPRAVLAHRA